MMAKLLLHPAAVDHARAIEQRTGTYAVVSGGVVELRPRQVIGLKQPKNYHLPPWEHGSHQWCAWRTDYGLEHDLCPCPCHGNPPESQENSKDRQEFLDALG